MNEVARGFTNRTPLRVERIVFTALAGILFGFFVLLIFRLPHKFTYYLIAGPIILFIVILSGKPKRFFQGMLVFIIALIVSLQLASTARAVFANPIPAIDAAGAGSVLLAQVQSIKATSAWLVPFKFFGIATEFLAIVMGLGTIVYVLTAQTEMLKKGWE